MTHDRRQRASADRDVISGEVATLRLELDVSVDGAGNVNGDNFDDVIIGATKYDNGETDEGGAFVYYGAVDGSMATTPDAMIENKTKFLSSIMP